MALCKPAAGEMVQLEQADESVQEPEMAEYFVQNATKFVCSLECMSSLLIENVFLKSRMNREVQVRFCEEQGVKFPLLTRLVAVGFRMLIDNSVFTFCQIYFQRLKSCLLSKTTSLYFFGLS